MHQILDLTRIYTSRDTYWLFINHYVSLISLPGDTYRLFNKHYVSPFSLPRDTYRLFNQHYVSLFSLPGDTYRLFSIHYVSLTVDFGDTYWLFSIHYVSLTVDFGDTYRLFFNHYVSLQPPRIPQKNSARDFPQQNSIKYCKYINQRNPLIFQKMTSPLLRLRLIRQRIFLIVLFDDLLISLEQLSLHQILNHHIYLYERHAFPHLLV